MSMDNKMETKTTVNGYDVYECISALQKYVRRAMEEEAMFFAIEIESVGWMATVISRLRVISQEDIGLGDPTAVLFALQSLDLCEKWYKDKKTSWRLALGNAIMSLCRANKSRLGDNFQSHVMGMRENGIKYELIDCGLDKHTRRGKKMGRGFKHFIEEGAVLIPPPKYSDRDVRYEKSAIARWYAMEKKEDLFA